MYRDDFLKMTSASSLEIFQQNNITRNLVNHKPSKEPLRKTQKAEFLTRAYSYIYKLQSERIPPLWFPCALIEITREQLNWTSPNFLACMYRCFQFPPSRFMDSIQAHRRRKASKCKDCMACFFLCLFFPALRPN